jgi:hypothetical protein
MNSFSRLVEALANSTSALKEMPGSLFSPRGRLLLALVLDSAENAVNVANVKAGSVDREISQKHQSRCASGPARDHEFKAKHFVLYA